VDNFVDAPGERSARVDGEVTKAVPMWINESGMIHGEAGSVASKEYPAIPSLGYKSTAPAGFQVSAPHALVPDTTLAQDSMSNCREVPGAKLRVQGMVDRQSTTCVRYLAVWRSQRSRCWSGMSSARSPDLPTHWWQALSCCWIRRLSPCAIAGPAPTALDSMGRNRACGGNGSAFPQGDALQQLTGVDVVSAFERKHWPR